MLEPDASLTLKQKYSISRLLTLEAFFPLALLQLGFAEQRHLYAEHYLKVTMKLATICNELQNLTAAC